MKNQFKLTIALLAALLGVPLTAAAQTAMTTTTLSAAVTSGSATTVSVASATNISAGGFLYVDGELMTVTGTYSSGTIIPVRRGATVGGVSRLHTSGATVYVVAPGEQARKGFINYDLTGACTATDESILPRVNTANGNVFDCTGGRWTITNGYFYLPPSACYSAVSGNGTGTNGYTVAGASSTPVVQAQTSATGTNTHTYVCTIEIPSRLIVGRGVSINDVTFFYGVQSNAIGTQAATLASGTMNSSIVFAKIAYPTAAASETPSTVTPVRADSGTLTITPAVASANTATTTAGSFYSVKFTPASGIQMSTDLQQMLLTVTLQCSATTATITNSPGLLVHYSMSL